MKRITRDLLHRSQQAFTLALEIFNKPTIQYRIEGFCFFFINAWELLAKARLIDTSGKESSIYYSKKKGQPQRSLSIRDAILRVIPNEKDPVRRNIEKVAEIRDKAMHLLVPEMEAIYGGLFQAGVLNYVDYLRTWFKRTIGDRATPPLLSLVWDLKDLEPQIIRKRYGESVLKFLQEQRADLQDEENKMEDRKFSISIEYKLVLTKKPKEADISLGAGPGGAITGQIIEVPKDVSVTHPYTQKPAVLQIQKSLGAEVSFTTFDFQAILHKENIKKADSSFHYLLRQTGTHCYSNKLVTHIVDRIKADPQYLGRARESYKHYLKKSKLSK